MKKMNYEEIIYIHQSITPLHELRNDFPKKEDKELHRLDTFAYRLQKAFKQQLNNYN